jgi:hypothetical protein
MEQKKAVAGALRDIVFKHPSTLSDTILDDIQQQFEWLWQIGWEERGKELAENRWNKRPYKILQYDKEGNLIGEYNTPKEAISYGGICRTSLWNALKTGKKTDKGHTWKREYI